MVKTVSFLLPTRGRYDWLVESIESIIKKSTSLENFDILLAMDYDDVATIEQVENYIKCNNYDAVVKLYLFERKHYHNLNLYVNELAIKSTAKYVCLWNDDAQILTEKWDKIMNNYIDNQDKLYVYQFPNNHYPDIFPVVPKQWIDITGYFSKQAHNDSWIQYIAIQLGVNKEIPIQVNHYKGNPSFAGKYSESVKSAQFSSPDFQSDRCLNERNTDVAKLREKLYSN